MRRYNLSCVKVYIILLIFSLLVCIVKVEPVKSAVTKRVLTSTTKTKFYTFDSYLSLIGKRKFELILIIIDRKSGKKIYDAEVSFKITTPSGKEETVKEVIEIGAYKYGAYFSLQEKGTHVITCIAKIKGKKEEAKLEYEIN